jgi:hypothetical protein
MDVILSNPEKKPINWKLDEKIFENEKVFSIHPVKLLKKQTLFLLTSNLFIFLINK